MSIPGDKVPVQCPACDRRLMVPESTIGKQGRCPKCQTVFTLEQLYEAEPVAAPSGGGFAGNDFGFNAAAAPASSSPFTSDDFKDDYKMQPAAPTPTITPMAYNPPATGYGGSYTPKKESTFWSSSVLGGVAMMVIAVVWFVGGLAADIIFFYPPILFIIGLVAFFKGLFGGNLAGE